MRRRIDHSRGETVAVVRPERGREEHASFAFERAIAGSRTAMIFGHDHLGGHGAGDALRNRNQVSGSTVLKSTLATHPKSAGALGWSFKTLTTSSFAIRSSRTSHSGL